MSEKLKDESPEAARAALTLPGTVERIIPSMVPGSADKAEISIQGAEELYREIRVENTLIDADGNQVSLNKGADVEVTIEAEPEATQRDSKAAARPEPG